MRRWFVLNACKRYKVAQRMQVRRSSDSARPLCTWSEADASTRNLVTVRKSAGCLHAHGQLHVSCKIIWGVFWKFHSVSSHLWLKIKLSVADASLAMPPRGKRP